MIVLAIYKCVYRLKTTNRKINQNSWGPLQRFRLSTLQKKFHETYKIIVLLFLGTSLNKIY